ncbi:MAG: hypothetical protein P0S94_04980 [Simkaniaceae bacterium]|nr:hypothetical protein [Simkaniaceae bacterium]
MKKWLLPLFASCGLFASTITTVSATSEKQMIKFEHPESWKSEKHSVKDASVYLTKDNKKCWYFCWWMNKETYSFDELIYWSDDLIKQVYPKMKFHSSTLSLQQNDHIGYRKYTITKGDQDLTAYVSVVFLKNCRMYFVIETNEADAINDMNTFIPLCWIEEKVGK